MTNTNSGIYVLTNTVENKVYVGSAKNFHKRWITHFKKLNFGGHENPNLQLAYDTYGKDSFTHAVLEITTPPFYSRELFWVIKYNAMDPKFGYNIVPPMRDIDSTILEGIRTRRSRPHELISNKPVIQVSLADGSTTEWVSRRRCEEAHPSTSKSIWTSLDKRPRNLTYNNCIWVDKSVYNSSINFVELIDKFKKRRVAKPKPVISKAIYLTLKNLSTNEVRSFYSRNEIAEYLQVSPNHVAALKMGYKNKGRGKITQVKSLRNWVKA